jgi:hypothetical protein
MLVVLAQNNEHNVLLKRRRECRDDEILPAARLSWALFARARDIHGERPSAQLVLIERGNGLTSATRHFDESKPFETTGLPIRNQIDLVHRPIRAEKRPDVVFSGAKRKIADVNIRGHS